MSRHQIGTKNGQWRGGKTIASNGYVLIRKPGHHLADSRGYVYEHRLVAEKMLGRRLRTGEIVHHRDGVKTHNAPGNLVVLPSVAHHVREHAGASTRRAPGEANRTCHCACGCGTRLERFDAFGRPRRYVSGHNMRRAR